MSYYDVEPLITLEQPLCLVGAAGCRSGSIAKAMAGLSGIPVVEVDRMVEHRAGKSLVAICVTHGQAAWRQVEHEELVSALGRQPPAVIALGPGALDREDSRQAVAAQARLIYLRWRLVELAAAARQLTVEQPGGFPELHGTPPTALGLGPLLQRRKAFYEAGEIVDGAGRVPWQVAMALIKTLR